MFSLGGSVTSKLKPLDSNTTTFQKDKPQTVHRKDADTSCVSVSYAQNRTWLRHLVSVRLSRPRMRWKLRDCFTLCSGWLHCSCHVHLFMWGACEWYWHSHGTNNSTKQQRSSPVRLGMDGSVYSTWPVLHVSIAAPVLDSMLISTLQTLNAGPGEIILLSE